MSSGDYWMDIFLWGHSTYHSIFGVISPFYLGYLIRYYKVAHSTLLLSFSVCVIRGSIQSFITDSGNCVFILVTLVRDLSILLIFSKKHLFCSLIFRLVFLFLIDLCMLLPLLFTLFIFVNFLFYLRYLLISDNFFLLF